MSWYSLPPKPKSLLGWHRQLSPSAGVKVSPLCFGAMNLGTAWTSFMGAVDEKASFELLDYFYEQGGNFIDTASSYQDEQSEIIIGKWMKERGVRDEMVVVTKFGTGWQTHTLKQNANRICSNFGGLNAKNLKHSLDASLAKLQTSFVDVLYIHWWDYSSDVEEIMYALNDVVQQGKVLYLGVSDTPAWIVSKANEFARSHNLRPFVLYQGKWSVATRDMEREIIPMCRAEGMGIAPWGAVGGGDFKTAAEREKDPGRKSIFLISDDQKKAIAELEKMAEAKGIGMTSLALAYVMHKAPYVFPIVGVRKVSHLKGNIEALGLKLTRDEIKQLEKAAPFDLGFPNNLFSPSGTRDVSGIVTAADSFGNQMFVNADYVELQQPIPAALHAND